MVRDFHEKMPGTFRSGLTNGKTDTIQGIIFEKDSIKINGSKVDRNCSFSKIDQESKGNAFQVLQEVEQQVVQANFSESAVGGYHINYITIQSVLITQQSALRRHTCRVYGIAASEKTKGEKPGKNTQNKLKQ